MKKEQEQAGKAFRICYRSDTLEGVSDCKIPFRKSQPVWQEALEQRLLWQPITLGHWLKGVKENFKLGVRNKKFQIKKTE